jgi:MerR family transcriptional regulator/heat shock protein HspR
MANKTDNQTGQPGRPGMNVRAPLGAERADSLEQRLEEVAEAADSEGCYVISIAARMVGMHQQTLRYYERMGLIEPSRSRGNIRLYSPADIGRLRQIQRLINDLGVNLAGVEVIIRMNKRLQEAEAELQRLREEVELCRRQHRSLARLMPPGDRLV